MEEGTRAEYCVGKCSTALLALERASQMARRTIGHGSSQVGTKQCSPSMADTNGQRSLLDLCKACWMTSAPTPSLTSCIKRHYAHSTVMLLYLCQDLDRSHGCPSTIQDLDRSRGHTPTFFATNSGVVPQSRVWLFLQRGNAIRFSRYALRAFHKYRHGDHGMVE